LFDLTCAIGHHLTPNTYRVAIMAAMAKVSLEYLMDITLLNRSMEPVAIRNSVISRDVRTITRALDEIKRIAKEKGYPEILEVLEREHKYDWPDKKVFDELGFGETSD